MEMREMEIQTGEHSCKTRPI